MTTAFIDQNLFADDAIDDETRAINQKLIDATKGAPPLDRVPLEKMREQRANGTGIFPARPKSDRAITKTIPGKDCDVGLRIIAPEHPAGVYLHMHGGGWINGAKYCLN